MKRRCRVTQVVNPHSRQARILQGAMKSHGDVRGLQSGTVVAAENEVVVLPGGPDHETLLTLATPMLSKDHTGALSEVNSAATTSCLGFDQHKALPTLSL